MDLNDSTVSASGIREAEDSFVSYDDAIAPGPARILFMGPRRSGKSSIERVVFHKMSPHETLFLESTNSVDIHLIANNNFVRFQTWDFGGDMSLVHDVAYMGQTISLEKIFRNCGTLVYVIDAQEEDYEDALPKLVETVGMAHSVNPAIHFEVFLHKVDADFMSEETKGERQQDIEHYVSTELSGHGDVLVSYYLTSIYDHSALEAFSKVIQKLVPQLPTLNNLLDTLISSCCIDKSYLVDVVTKLYIATDSNPVDVHTYELCSDLVDVVIDVSHIYGITDGGATVPYDDKSTSATHLNTGMVLYLREVSSYLALVCVLRKEHFAKRALLDYNIDCFRKSLEKVFNI
jgi:Ras-related GTP-binding protein C/D